jgi:hypothetical protein
VPANSGGLGRRRPLFPDKGLGVQQGLGGQLAQELCWVLLNLSLAVSASAASSVQWTQESYPRPRASWGGQGRTVRSKGLHIRQDVQAVQEADRVLPSYSHCPAIRAAAPPTAKLQPSSHPCPVPALTAGNLLWMGGYEVKAGSPGDPRADEVGQERPGT